MFTRHLYARDEVETLLLTVLLKREDMCEAYFWAYELHYSGFDLFSVIWRIYYDVYFELNPRLEKYLSKKSTLWEKRRDPDVFAYCIKNLFLAAPSSKVFVLRQSALANGYGGTKTTTARAYKGRPPKWCAKHPSKYHSWLRAVSKRDYPNIAYHTYSLVKNERANPDDMFAVLSAYFADTFEVDPDVDAYWKARKYDDDAHYLLSIIVHLLGDVARLPDPKATMAPQKIHLEMFRVFGRDDLEGCPPYRILNERRLYEICPTIGGFCLARRNDEIRALGEVYQANSVWERFVFDTPYWVWRFDTVGASYDADRKRVVFPSDDACEDFYDRYGCEPDEQSRAVRDRSLGPISNGDWKSWYDSVFVEPCLIEFDAEYRFIS